ENDGAWIPRRHAPFIPLAFGIFIISAPAHADFGSCLASLRSAALADGISAATFDRATAGLRPDNDILNLEANQPEYKTPIWHYLAGLVDEERVSDGRAKMQQSRE